MTAAMLTIVNGGCTSSRPQSVQAVKKEPPPPCTAQKGSYLYDLPLESASLCLYQKKYGLEWRLLSAEEEKTVLKDDQSIFPGRLKNASLSPDRRLLAVHWQYFKEVDDDLFSYETMDVISVSELVKKNRYLVKAHLDGRKGPFTLAGWDENGLRLSSRLGLKKGWFDAREKTVKVVQSSPLAATAVFILDIPNKKVTLAP